MGMSPITHRTLPSSRSPAPAARPSATRSSSPFSSIARTGSTYLERVVAGVSFLQVACEQVYGRLHVLLAHHLVRGVDVAAGDRERDGGDTAVQALDPCRYVHTPRAGSRSGAGCPRA